jgi:hypothetical protein
LKPAPAAARFRSKTPTATRSSSSSPPVDEHARRAARAGTQSSLWRRRRRDFQGVLLRDLDDARQLLLLPAA